ncbi:MAG: dUTP diphosphatase [Succinivibrio sp.]
MSARPLAVRLRILDPRLGAQYPLPSPATAGSAGVDLRAMIDKPHVMEPGEVFSVSAGFAMHIADSGVCACIFPRSGLGSRSGIVLANLTGVIDSDYQGPITVPLWNRSKTPFTVNPGDRIAQMVFMPVFSPRFEVCEEFPEESGRGQSGFGSTGRS